MKKIDECYDMLKALNDSEERAFADNETQHDPGIVLQQNAENGNYFGKVIFSNGLQYVEGDRVSSRALHSSVEAVIDDLHAQLVEATKKRTERMRGVIDSLAKFASSK